MTDEQVANWRRVLSMTIGPYALLMPKEEIIAVRDRMQEEIKNLPESKPEKNPFRKKKKRKPKEYSTDKDGTDGETWFQKALRKK